MTEKQTKSTLKSPFVFNLVLMIKTELKKHEKNRIFLINLQK